MHRIGLALFLCIFSITLSAVDILRFQSITDHNGLSQNTIRCMLEDSRGFLWVGTINGLNRYDGKEFMVINSQIASGNMLSDNRIRSIHEDSYGYIWVRTFSNTLFCYDPRLETFIDYDPQNNSKTFSSILMASNGDVWLRGPQGCCRIRHTDGKLEPWRPVADSMKDKAIHFTFEDSRQKIWIGGKEGIFLIEGEKVTRVKQENSFFNAHEWNEHIYFIANDRIAIFDKKQNSFLPDLQIKNLQSPYKRSHLLQEGLILIATKDELYAFDTQTKNITSAEKHFNGNMLKDAGFLSDNQGNLWIYNMSGILWRQLPNNTFEPYHLIPEKTLALISQERYSVYHDSRNIIWITTFGNGLFAIDQNDGQMYHYHTGKDLATNFLFCVMEDRSGEIWIGTELAGLSKISLSNYPFDIFYPTPEGNTDRDNAVRLIYEDHEEKYWFGTRNGDLHIYNAQLKYLHKYRIKNGLPFCMAEDKLGNKWLGTKGSGIWIFPSENNRAPQIYQLHDYESQSSSSNNVFSITSDTKGRMWMASFGGGLHLAEWINDQLVLKQFYLESNYQNMMRTIIQDREGYMWVGTNEGLVIFEPDKIIADKKDYLSLDLTSGKHQSLENNEIRVLFEDSQGRIWLGTTGGGLNLLIKEKPLVNSWFKVYNSNNGLSNEMVQAIREDNEGHIWVSTESGISKFNPQTERFENFIFSNNRHAAIFNESSSWKRKNGELMFGSYNGVYIFNPTEINYNTYAPSVIITGLKINGNATLPGERDSPLNESITVSQKIELQYNQNSFNLECTLMNFHAPELNQYLYYLEGYEKGWNPISRNHIAAYRNLPPGSYKFRVKGCNSFGTWSEKETILQIIVFPPWWKSGWAIFFYFIATFIILYFALKLIFKMHRLNMEVEVEKQLTEYKLRFFTNISHEFRTPLTIIRGVIENLSSQEHLPTPVRGQLNILTKSSARLLRLIDQLLEFRRLQNNKMELKLEHTNPNVFLHEIFQTFKEIAQKRQIDFIFKDDECKKLLLDRSKIDKILYNLLSNALKNTPIGGKVMLKLNSSTEIDQFTFSVSDSGSGVPPEQRAMLFVRFKQIHYASDGTGIGLHLTSELVKVHRGDIKYSESEWGGACFTVSIPLTDINYDPADILQSTSLKATTMIAENKKSSVEEEIWQVSTEKRLSEYKVMIVEDDDDVRSFIELQLSRHFITTIASNGIEALKQVVSEQPDIVICDVMMPRMDGYEFTKRLKGEFETSHIPVILLTAYSSEEHQLEGIRSGADSYISKPFSISYLLTRITKLIEQRERLRRRFNTEPGLMQSSITFTDRDQVFMESLHKIIEENISSSDFKVEVFAQTLGMGRTTFFRKLKGITGYSPSEYVRIIRMKKAAELLMETDLNISEISYQIGINDPFYLSKCFKAQFGKSPSQYRKG